MQWARKCLALGSPIWGSSQNGGVIIRRYDLIEGKAKARYMLPKLKALQMVGMFLLPKKSISNDHLILGGGPLEAGRRELVGGEGAGAGGEGDRHHHGLLAWGGDRC